VLFHLAELASTIEGVEIGESFEPILSKDNRHSIGETTVSRTIESRSVERDGGMEPIFHLASSLWIILVSGCVV
jgi:hypothetical protein